MASLFLSTSDHFKVPSSSPTNLIHEDIAYIVRYAGEVRTIIRHPFQIDETGEVLPMNGSVSYQLCEVDEVEGRLAEYPNRMNFKIGNRCLKIRGGNPTVDLDPRFINHADLNVLDLSGLSASNIIPINVEQTLGADWLLKTDVNDDVCSTLPSPYDNDYRGSDPENTFALPNR